MFLHECTPNIFKNMEKFYCLLNGYKWCFFINSKINVDVIFHYSHLLMFKQVKISR